MRIILYILKSAGQELARNRIKLARALAVPAATILLLTAVSVDDTAITIAQVLIEFVAYLLMAVMIHRYILHPSSEHRYGDCWISVGLYALSSIGIGLIAGVVAIPFVLVHLFALKAQWPQVEFLAYIPAMYVLARLSLLLPHFAIGQSADMRQAWNWSRGNGWKLTITLVGIPYALNHAAILITEPLPLPAFEIAYTTLWIPITILEIALLSVAYRDLHGRTPASVPRHRY